VTLKVRDSDSVTVCKDKLPATTKHMAPRQAQQNQHLLRLGLPARFRETKRGQLFATRKFRQILRFLLVCSINHDALQWGTQATETHRWRHPGKMTWKSAPHIKLFRSLSAIRVVFCTSLHWNILCTISAKQHYA